MPNECLRCGACCRSLIVEADLLDAIREPRIAEVCGLPLPPPDACSVDEDDRPLCADPWDGRVAILAARGPERRIVGCPFLAPTNLCTIYPTRAEDLCGVCPWQQAVPGGPNHGPVDHCRLAGTFVDRRITMSKIYLTNRFSLDMLPTPEFQAKRILVKVDAVDLALSPRSCSSSRSRMQSVTPKLT